MGEWEDGRILSECQILGLGEEFSELWGEQAGKCMSWGNINRRVWVNQRI